MGDVLVIFLDVGAHDGQTLVEVTKPSYSFEHIYAFEPMPAQYAILARRFGGRPGVTLLNQGLHDRTGRAAVYGDNSLMESSVFPSKRDCNPVHVTECDFVAASEFFRRAIPTDAKAVVKLNCEGAEVPILDDLLDSGQIWKIGSMMIDFDIRKVRGHEYEEERILARFADIGFSAYSLCEDVMLGETHQERIAHWLAESA